MELWLDVLVEKPIAQDPSEARRLMETAERTQRVLMVGHLERFNPGIAALAKAVTTPLFFEIHRLSEFTQRSLDVDVVLDLMIHDLDIVLSLTGTMPEEIRAAGIHILSERVDIANVRLQFPGGCIANLTASRVSTERVRKLRLFQPREYISLDYGRQDGVRFTVGANRAIGFAPLPVTKDEPLRLELEEFFDCVTSRREPRVTGRQALAALEVARDILDKIEEHSQLVAKTLHEQGTP
jgi:predicted dehydrogenase